MPDDHVALYEAWDMTEPVVPSRSRLFNLSPVGFGTGLVECLTGYFSRLAEAHSVSTGALHHHEVQPLGAGRRNMFSCATSARARCYTSGINGTLSLAADYASVVGKLTGRSDLHYLTMIPWKSLFPAQLLMRGVAAWCATCLASWRKAGKPVYIPLLWTLEIVKYCPYHQRPLHLTCPHCGLPQPLLGQCSWVGFCTRCKRWLGSGPGKGDPERYSVLQQDTPEWEVWAANQLKDLIEAGFHNPPLLTREQLCRLVWIGTDLEGLSHFARILGVSSTAVHEWRRGRKQPLLPAYLRLARVLNVTLTALLTGSVSPDQIHSLDLVAVPFWRNLCVRRKSSFDRRRAALQMEQALQESPPPSLRTFRIRNGYHDATLQKHFPDLYKAIEVRFREHRAASFEKRRADKITEFRRIACQLHDQGIALVLNRILKQMPQPTGLDYRIARELLVQIKGEVAAGGRPCSKETR